MTCLETQRLTAIDRVKMEVLLKSKDFSARMAVVEPMYVAFIASEREYLIPSFNSEGYPIFDSNGNVKFSTAKRTFSEVTTVISDKMTNWDDSTVNILSKSIRSRSIDIDLEDAICVVSKYFVHNYMTHKGV